MRLSTRNQLTGTVASIDEGSVMSVVKVDLDGGQQITASITRDAVADLQLAVGCQGHRAGEVHRGDDRRRMIAIR